MCTCECACVCLLQPHERIIGLFPDQISKDIWIAHTILLILNGSKSCDSIIFDCIIAGAAAAAVGVVCNVIRLSFSFHQYLNYMSDHQHQQHFYIYHSHRRMHSINNRFLFWRLFFWSVSIDVGNQTLCFAVHQSSHTRTKHGDNNQGEFNLITINDLYALFTSYSIDVCRNRRRVNADQNFDINCVGFVSLQHHVHWFANDSLYTVMLRSCFSSRNSHILSQTIQYSSHYKISVQFTTVFLQFFILDFSSNFSGIYRLVIRFGSPNALWLL